MLGIDVGAPPLPEEEAHRIHQALRRGQRQTPRSASHDDERWWEEQMTFFDVQRSRAWVMTRRLTHTSHHRGQQMAMLRMLGPDLYSNYGPTADTGGLMESHAPTSLRVPRSLAALLNEAGDESGKAPFPGAGGNAGDGTSWRVATAARRRPTHLPPGSLHPARPARRSATGDLANGASRTRLAFRCHRRLDFSAAV